MPLEVTFLVQGSADEPYKVLFVNRGDGNISAFCTCPAGMNGLYCKHRINIINGKTDAIVSSNRAEVRKIQSWLIGSNIEAASREVESATRAVETAKAWLTDARKRLAQAMRY